MTMAELELALVRKLEEATRAGDYDRAEKIAVVLAQFREAFADDLRKST
jgi:hypothetical protein